jgi:hypothetical protein
VILKWITFWLFLAPFDAQSEPLAGRKGAEIWPACEPKRIKIDHNSSHGALRVFAVFPWILAFIGLCVHGVWTVPPLEEASRISEKRIGMALSFSPTDDCRRVLRGNALHSGIPEFILKHP